MGSFIIGPCSLVMSICCLRARPEACPQCSRPDKVHRSSGLQRQGADEPGLFNAGGEEGRSSANQRQGREGRQKARRAVARWRRPVRGAAPQLVRGRGLVCAMLREANSRTVRKLLARATWDLPRAYARDACQPSATRACRLLCQVHRPHACSRCPGGANAAAMVGQDADTAENLTGASGHGSRRGRVQAHRRRAAAGSWRARARRGGARAGDARRGERTKEIEGWEEGTDTWVPHVRAMSAPSQ